MSNVVYKSGKLTLIAVAAILVVSGTLGSEKDWMKEEPVPESGEVIWKHDFSQGMPEEFKHEANYPESGTWGRADDYYDNDKAGGVYEPASIQGAKLLVNAPSCSYKGVATPVQLDKGINDWELHYKVDDNPGSTGHSTRITAGGYLSVEPQGSYQKDINQLDRFGFEGGETSSSRFTITTLKGEEVSKATGVHGGFDEPVNVRIASSTEKEKTWVKWWSEEESEPEEWLLEFEGAAAGRPSLGAKGTCKGEPRSNEYYFYELRNISFGERPVNFSLTSLEADKEYTEGDTIDISARTKNYGSSGEQEIVAELGNLTEKKRSISLGKGETLENNFSFETIKGDSGTYHLEVKTENSTMQEEIKILKPGTLSLKEVEENDRVGPGETLSIKVKISNEGDSIAEGTLNASNKLDTIQENVEIRPGDEKTKEYKFSTDEVETGESIQTSVSAGDDSVNVVTNVEKKSLIERILDFIPI